MLHVYMKRASHVGCNACDARIQRVLHRICNSNIAHMKRASSVQHTRDICAKHSRGIHVTFAKHSHNIRNSTLWGIHVTSLMLNPELWRKLTKSLRRFTKDHRLGRVEWRFMTRLLRVCRPFMCCRCLALLARWKCVGPWVTFDQHCIWRRTRLLYWAHEISILILSRRFLPS
jgi:hypothetical protein